MRKTWEEGVLTALKHTRFAHFTMPRQTGTTTFMVLLANKWHRDGKSVAYLSFRQDMAKTLQARGNEDPTGLYPPVVLDKGISIGTLSTEWGDAKFDRIILDNVIHAHGGSVSVEEFREHHLAPGYTETLWIDTI